MTEQNNGNWTEEYPAHDLWRIEKSITPLPDEEQLAKWEQAGEVLRDLGRLAETLSNDPLILALTDAMDRAEEERGRLQGRLQRSEGWQLHPREEERLRRLLKRDDALSTAHTVILDNEGMYPEAKARTLEVLKAMHEEASEQFRLYKQEVGIPERTEAPPA
jgi:tRNA(Met) C34 N-acetyltransferase TmcA